MGKRNLIVLTLAGLFGLFSCGGSSSSSSDDFFFTSAKQTTPVITASGTSSIYTNTTATWDFGNVMYEIFNSLQDFTPIVNVQFSYRIDSWSWSAWSTVSAATLTNMSNGVHSLQVRARDDAGNISAAASRDFVLDYYVPHVAFTGGPANNSTVSTTSVSISWSGSDNLTPTPNLRYSWQLDSGGWATYSTAVATTLSGLTVGTHIVKVQAEDAAGNISTPAVINFTIVHLTAATRPAR